MPPLQVPRSNHAAALLPDGRLLVAGGVSTNGDVAEAELFDPIAGRWSPTGSLNVARSGLALVALRDGTVLAVGGNKNHSDGGKSTAELYDPSTGTWTLLAAPLLDDGVHAPAWHNATATLLQDGRVLIAGGFGCCSDGSIFADSSSQVYDPATKSFVQHAFMSWQRTGLSATLLPSGRVLVVGGTNGGINASPSTAEIYDPGTATWTLTANLPSPHVDHTASLLRDGRVLIAGGYDGAYPAVDQPALLYDPGSASWSLAGAMLAPRHGHGASALADGRVLVTNGAASSGQLTSTEIFDPASGSWSSAGDDSAARSGHTQTSLADGTVLVVGGRNDALGPLALTDRYSAGGGGPCDAATVEEMPPDQTMSAYGWTFDVSVTPYDGFVVRNVKLGPRYMADQISVPYFTLQTTALATPVHGELRPDGSGNGPRSRLVDFSFTAADPFAIEATYAIDQLAPGSKSCLIVRQRYEFGSENPDGGCEPSNSLTFPPGGGIPIPAGAPSIACNRWKPRIEYEFHGDPGDSVVALNIPQRLFFRDEGRTPNYGTLFRDNDFFTFPPDPIAARHDFAREGIFSAIVQGGAGAWDNYHQSYKRVEPPTANPLPAPGCPECVHIHWRWGALAGPAYGNGRPLIPGPSNQSVEIAVVRFVPGEEHPVSFRDLLDAHAFFGLDRLAGQDLVFWYSATGHQDHDVFFDHGAFFSSLGKADLRVQMTPSLQRARREGDEITYFITVTNDGPATATGVTLHDVWSKPDTTVDSSRTSSSCGGSPQTVDCKVGRMAPGASVNLSITLRVRSISDLPLIDFAQVTGRQLDPNPLNNYAVTRTPIMP